MRDEAMARWLASVLRYWARLGRVATAPLVREPQRAAHPAPIPGGDRPPAAGATARTDIRPGAGEPGHSRGDAERAAVLGRRARPRQGLPVRAAPPPRLSLALQGGGAHGAFTWGVLDRLLEDERIAFEAVSGTSAGAVNAVLLVSGGLAEGRAWARRALDAFWGRLAELVPPGPFQPSLRLLTKTLSPYQFNPLDLNPLRALLAEFVDFEAIRRAEEPRLFVAATRVRTGESRVFRNHEMSVDAVLASACLPELHHAVEIDGEPYWDGGFSSNPPLLPLVEDCRERDLLLVQLTPSEVADLPLTAPGIRGRMSQIVFTAPLLHELRALEADARRTRTRLHRIDATPVVASLGPESAGRPDRDLLVQLREQGRAAADDWLGAAVTAAVEAA